MVQTPAYLCYYTIEILHLLMVKDHLIKPHQIGRIHLATSGIHWRLPIIIGAALSEGELSCQQIRASTDLRVHPLCGKKQA